MTRAEYYNKIYDKVKQLPVVDGIQHLQLDKSIVSNHPYYDYLDAVYIGLDKTLNFLVSDKDGDTITVLDIKNINIGDLDKLLKII